MSQSGFCVVVALSDVFYLFIYFESESMLHYHRDIA